MIKCSTSLIAALLLTGAAITIDAFSAMSVHAGREGGNSIDQAPDAYNTNLVFTGRTGRYLSNVKISIRDDTGKQVISGESSIPMVLADLKPGRYTVEAEASGYNKRRAITVSGKLKTFLIQFEVNEESEFSQTPVLNEDGHNLMLKYPG